MNTQIASNKRAKFYVQHYLNDIGAIEIGDLRDALSSVGCKVKLSRTASIKHLMHLGFNALEMEDPQHESQRVKARPVKLQDASSYLMKTFDINAQMIWRKNTQVYLQVEGDTRVFDKITAILGEARKSLMMGCDVRVFLVTGLGKIHVTKYSGFRGRSFGIVLINE